MLSVLLTVILLEVYLRSSLSHSQIINLPYYGLSQDDQHHYIWKNQSTRNIAGTITKPRPFDVQDSLLGWRTMQNADVLHSKTGLWKVRIKTDSSGLRSRGEFNEKNKDAIRIGIFGASQTFGESVADNEVYVSLLNGKYKNAEVLNYGIRGYGTDQMLLYYESEAKNRQLDIIILAFAFHHIPRNVRTFTFFAKPYYKIKDGVIKLQGVPIQDELSLYDKEFPQVNNNLLNYSVLMRFLLKYLSKNTYNQVYSRESKEWTITKKILHEYYKKVNKNGSRFILVNIENKHANLEPALDKFIEKYRIEYLNIGPTIRSRLSDDEPIIIPNDVHWTSLGHKLVAEEINAYLCKSTPNLLC